jgi:hypothetical protein
MWLNAKLAFDYGLYASHVFHEHHLLPLFATAIAFLHMTLAAHDRQTNIGGGGGWRRQRHMPHYARITTSAILGLITIHTLAVQIKPYQEC